MALVREAELVTHLCDPAPGVGQKLLGALDPLPQQILVRAQPGPLLEQPAEVEGLICANAANAVTGSCWSRWACMCSSTRRRLASGKPPP
jgi:hypothetical protein